jgi:hypothetical protein
MKTNAHSVMLTLSLVVLLDGCATQTGQIGEPIGSKYQSQLNQLQIGHTTPIDLQKSFNNKASLKEKGKGYEVWEVAKPGDLDVGSFLLWGQIAHDKDQSLLFRFENGVLVSYNSAVTN